MKISRRKLFTFLMSGFFISKEDLFALGPLPGSFKIYSDKMKTSGVLKLNNLDMIMKVPEKVIFGDGHSHIVPLNDRAWLHLAKGQSLLVRSGVDSDEKKHSHWIKVSS